MWVRDVLAWLAVGSLVSLCGCGSEGALGSDGGIDATSGADAGASSCPASCTLQADCAPWGALCKGKSTDAGTFACAPCSGPDDDINCDRLICGRVDGGSFSGACDTATGRCRCFVLAADGGHSAYLDDGGPSCRMVPKNEGPPLCADAPSLPEGGTCSLPPYTPQVFTVKLWVEDDAAPGGGFRITLDLNQELFVGGHLYRNGGAGLFGGGPGGSIYGDVALDVDGQVNALQFHHVGCGSDRGGGVWDDPAALTRTSAFCPGCAPATIARHYVVTRGPCGVAGCAASYDFVVDEPPRSCGVGVDLMGFSLQGS